MHRWLWKTALWRLIWQINPNKEFPYITAAGEQRGDPRDKDSYMFAVISLNYKLRTGRSSFPMF